MKRMTAWLLLAVMLTGLWGCAGNSAPAAPTQTALPAATAAGDAAQTEAVPTAAEPEPSHARLFLQVSAITFSLVGESDDIYLGLAPREQVQWESENPEIVSVDGGVLTAVGVGTTTIRASYGDQQVSCTAGCLAETRQELEALDEGTLSAPKRLPPEVDLTVPCDYFDNAAIVGDSITYFLWQAESQNDYLGKLQFITRQGVSILSLVQRYKNLYFRGREMHIEDIAAKCDAERMYIALGCLDYQVKAGVVSLKENWVTMLDRIQKKRPDLDIVIISNIPTYTQENGPTQLDALIAENNEWLRQLAAERGCKYLDLSYYIQDHYGRMPAIYEKDKYHMNPTGSLVWMEIMRYYAQLERESEVLP